MRKRRGRRLIIYSLVARVGDKRGHGEGQGDSKVRYAHITDTFSVAPKGGEFQTFGGRFVFGL